MSMRRHLIKKIIREELAAAAKQRGKQRKILSEGLKTPEPTMHEPATNKAIRSRTAKSDSTSFVDPPNANLDRGDGRGRYFVEEAADEGDRKEFGVGLDGHIEHVPGYPTEDDHEPSIGEAVDPREREGVDDLGDPIQSLARAGRRPVAAVEPLLSDHGSSFKGQLSEAQIRRWKILAQINEQVAERPELPPLDLEGVPEAEEGDIEQGEEDMANMADEIDDMGADVDAAVADVELPAGNEPLPELEPIEEPEIDFEDPDLMFAGEEEFEIEPDAEPLPGLEDLQAEFPDMPDFGADALEQPVEDLGAPAHRDDGAAISLRIREEITRILKEKL